MLVNGASLLLQLPCQQSFELIDNFRMALQEILHLRLRFGVFHLGHSTRHRSDCQDESDNGSHGELIHGGQLVSFRWFGAIEVLLLSALDWVEPLLTQRAQQEIRIGWNRFFHVPSEVPFCEELIVIPMGAHDSCQAEGRN